MNLSHSKLATILSCPMTYYLRYEAGVFQKVEKPALAIGSAVHWGIEHDTDDLSQYFKDQGMFKQGDNYTPDQMLAEAMVRAYIKKKPELYEEMLRSPKNGKKLELLEDTHEVYLTGKLPNNVGYEEHKFVGIVDLLLLTNEGFILVDYKTSSKEPDWDAYLDQLYRYIFELRSNFPEVPVLKIAIINIRKTAIRMKKGETDFEFRQRQKLEYECNADKYVVYHEFLPEDLNEKHINDYIKNLEAMCDVAESIRLNKTYFINYAAAKGMYGKSEFWDIFYRTKGAECLYGIRDYVWNDELGKFHDSRDCVAIDMQIIDYAREDCTMLLNKYDKYKTAIAEFNTLEVNDEYDNFEDYVKAHYITDDSLLQLYKLTYQKEQEVKEHAGK